MKIERIYEDKRRFYALLLQADEQPEMIERYLDRGEMFVMRDDEGGIIAVAVVTDEGERVCELKNLAVDERLRGRGYGRRMLELLCDHYRGSFERMFAGTGDAPTALVFYERCGFVRSHCVENFFADNYDHPIIEAGVRLKDMIYLVKKL